MKMQAFLLLGIYLCVAAAVSSAVADVSPAVNGASLEALLRRIEAVEKKHADDLVGLNKKLLEAERIVEDLQDTAAALAEQVKVTTEGTGSDKKSSKRELQNSAEIAFTAYLNHDQNSIGANQPIVFNKILTNEGSGYSNHTGAFTAPLQGVYYFNFFIGERGDQQLFAALTHNSHNVVDAVVETVQKLDDAQGGNAATIKLNRGDVVMVKHLGSSAGDHLEGSRSIRTTTFTGFLIYRTEQDNVEPIIG